MNLPPASRYQSALLPSRASFVHGTLDGTKSDWFVVAKAVKFKNEFAKIKVTDSGADKTLCFGHIQKMFSMALKLFLCLKICAEQANEMNIDIGLNIEHFECNFSFETADCPIDSIILDNLGKEISNVKWSKLGQDKAHPSTDYIKVQKAIREQQNDDAKSNLCFDFENWN